MPPVLPPPSSPPPDSSFSLPCGESPENFSRREAVGGFRQTFSARAVDAVIIGAGGAGLTAAAILGEQALKRHRKLRIVLLEKQPFLGGSTLISGGLWSVADTDWQKKEGIADSQDRFFQDLRRNGRFRNKPELVRAFLPANEAQFSWMRRCGVEPYSLVAGEGVVRAHAFKPEQWIECLRRRCLHVGVVILTGAEAQRLLWDSRRQALCGVAYRRGGKARLLSADRVILTSGGFARNHAMLSQWMPAMRTVASVAAVGATGDGILMGQAVGADLDDMPFLQASYPFRLHPRTIDDMTLLPYLGALIVNRRGERFVDEFRPYKELARAVLAEQGGESFLLFDERCRLKALREDLNPAMWTVNDASLTRKKNSEVSSQGWIRTDNWTDAAAYFGLPARKIKKTIADFNEYVAGKRRELSPRSTSLSPIDISRPPFYIFPVCACLLGTYCGLAINERAQVLDVFGEPIPHLWAAGEVTGGFHGAGFVMGTGVAKAMAFGRIAALSLWDDYCTGQRRP